MRFFGLLLFLLLSAPALRAAECLDIFSSATQTSAPDLTLPPFSTSSVSTTLSSNDLTLAATDYGDVTLGQNGTLRMATTNGVYRLNSLTLGKNSNSYWAPGDYYIDTLYLEQGADIIVSGTGTVRIYANSITIEKNSDISNGSVYLILISYGDMLLDQGVRINGAIYAEGTITVNKNSRINGAIHGGTINVEAGATINYNTDYIVSADFDGMCDGATLTNLDHIEITTDGDALTCSAETITLRACADTNCTTVATQDVIVDLSVTGNAIWSTDPLTIPANSSAGISVDLIDRTVETVTLSVASSSPTAINPLVCSNGSCDVAYNAAGYILELPHHSACSTSSLSIQAVKLADNGLSCAPAYTGNQAVNFAFAYVNPNTGATIPELDSSPMASAGSIQSRTINFDANASASLDFSYNDAGQISITVSDAGDNGLAAATVNTVVSPAKLMVYTSDANNSCGGPDFGACSPFRTAGVLGNASSEFNLIVAGACTDDSLTNNFQLNNIALTPNLIAPSAGTNASLGVTSVDITSNGQVTVAQTISDVGAFSITATAGNYLGQPLPPATSAPIGRFTPHRFLLTDNSPMLEDASCDFTYQDQQTFFAPGLAPEITITAVNSAGSTTTNYGGDAVVNHDFWHFNSADFSDRLYSNLATPYPGTLSAFLGAATLSGQTNYDGVFSVSFTNDALTHNKASATPQISNDGPFDAQVQLNLSSMSLTDADSISYDSDNNGSPDDFISSTIGGTNVRWGRWTMENGYGSELQALAMNAIAQYFDGNKFVTASTDSCTNPINITLSNYTGNLSAGETTLSQSPISSGILPLSLSAPGVDNTGSVLLTVTSPAWLQYDYDGDGSLDDAQATATFGIYQGRRPIIIKRQNY